MSEPADLESRTKQHIPVLDGKNASRGQLEDTLSKVGLDLSIEEIAQRLGISEEGACALIEAAMKQIQGGLG